MIRVRQVKVNVENDSINHIKKKTAVKLGILPYDVIDIKINKQSLDARKKPELYYLYEVDANVKNEAAILANNKSNDVLKTPVEEYKIDVCGEKENKRTVIVGAGPAGLMCAYALAENGFKPLVIERGKEVDERISDVEKFWETGVLNQESNVQFGEGGAGTFSDGKLNTMVKDPEFRCKKVFDIFVEAGADADIRYVNKPHVGTDVLRTVVKNIREKIKSMGGEFRYNTCFKEFVVENNEIKKVIVNEGEEIECSSLVLAIGHSARDTFEYLNNHLEMTSKPFAIGIRIQHPQKMINRSQMGVESHDKLPNASYKLTHQTRDGRGVYTFCMCPGGFVVNSSSEEGRLAINGMSNRARETENANSAVIVTVTPEDFGDKPLDGIEFQRNLEKLTFENGKGLIPVQTYKDFKENKKTESIGRVNPIFKGNYTLSNLNDFLPKFMTEALVEAIESFDRKIGGYAREDALLAAIESRTSSPVKIIRNEDFESNITGIFPCGEGAGYAGGITSAAMDGLKVAEQIASIYKKR